MSSDIERLRATMTPDQFEDLCEDALRRSLASDPDAVAVRLPIIAEEMRAEGFTEEQIRLGVGTFAAEAGLHPGRGYN